MASLRRFLRRLLHALRPGCGEPDLARELASHLQLLEEDFARRGLTPTDARRAANGALGGVERTKDLYRDARSFLWLDDAGRDLQYAVRSLMRNPGFTATVVLTLALGIGANTAIFSVVNSVLLKPLPYLHADRLVRLVMHEPADDSPTGTPRRLTARLTAAEIAQIRSATRTLSHVGSVGGELVGLSGLEEAARLQGARVSSSVLEMIGARPFLGRLFDATDEAPGAEPVALISYRAWQQYFGRDSNIIGRSLTFDAVLGPRRQSRYTVVGVMPDGLDFPGPQNHFWMPFQRTTGSATRGPTIARLAEGHSIEAATAEIGSILRELRKGERDSDRVTYGVVREQDELVAPVRPALLMLTIAAGFVLLIACVNVANLMLARTAARQQEFAARIALGAGRGRVTRQLLTESVLLAITGGMVGTGLAVGGVRLLRSLATTLGRFDLGIGREFPRLAEIGIDGTALAFTLGASLITGLLIGLAPVLRYARLDMARALRGRPGSSDACVGRFTHLGMRPLLVVAEISMAMALFVGGGLLMRSFVTLARVDAGYNPADVLTFQVALPGDRYPDDARLLTFAEDVVSRLRSVPGVQKAAYARQLPLVQLVEAFQLRTTPELPTPPSQTPPLQTPMGGDLRLVSTDYLDVMGVRVVAGRGFDEHDTAGRPRVLLVNQALANRAFKNDTPVGKIVYVGRDALPWEIVGIVANVRQFGLDRASEPQFFADLRQWPAAGFPLFPIGAYYVVRTAEDSSAIVPSVRAIVRALDTQAALFNVASMEQIVSNSIAQPRLYAVLVGIFAGVGVLLAAIGVYGVMAYSVAQRTREIGIRTALGAQRAEVVRLVLRQSTVLTVLGIALGLVGAAAGTQYMEGLLFGLTPLDPTTFVVVGVLFGVIATFAAYVPARRAAHVDPLVALRAD